jgi:CRISPR-associated protein Cas5t
MLGVYVTIPVACFRKGLAREYLETEPVPPPATCYGFLLALVGEEKRGRHVRCRVSPVLLSQPELSTVVRMKWKIDEPLLGSPGNTIPDFQQLLTGIELLVWLDSSGEEAGPERLEDRVRAALTPPVGLAVRRFGGLSLGESTHLVDEVSLWDRVKDRLSSRKGRAFLTRDDKKGRLTLPVWVDHVGSADTRYATGDLIEMPLSDTPAAERLPVISPEQANNT